MEYKYVILSDIHLGSKDSNPNKVIKFLESINFETLILNGDIIDGWKIRRGGNLQKKEVKLLKYILKISKHKKVIYLRGNHDDFLDHMIPIMVGDIELKDQHDLVVGNKKYYVIHGDVFDKVTSELKWIAYIGDIGYTFLIKMNKLANIIRKWRGKPYYSFSKKIKENVKQAVNYISSFEKSLVKLAKRGGYDGIICGHIHTAEIKDIGGVMYYNSGDWVESMSGLVYSNENGWEIIWYNKNN